LTPRALPAAPLIVCTAGKATPLWCGRSIQSLGPMRPTVAIGEWRVAVDLDEAGSIQNQPGTPAFGCSCAWCENWPQLWPRVFPADLVEQLRRLRIDLSHPSDLYGYSESPRGAECRVIYHTVGKILSGPNVWIEDPQLGKVFYYARLREAPELITLAVVPARETRDDRPNFDGRDLLQVDFRLFVPADRDISTTPLVLDR